MNDEKDKSENIPPGWNVPGPAHIPASSVWPATVAFGSMLLLWGILTSPLISAVGFLLLCGAITAWIGEIRDDRRR